MPNTDVRKRTELSIKLEALTTEMLEWLEVTETGAQLQKHHTQLRRIDAELSPVVGRLQDDIDVTDVARDWRRLERHVLELHRVWDFFRDKFALRLVPWLIDYLVAADEYAWAGYQPAQQAAVQSGTVASEAVREPPLVCFTVVSSPFSIPRGASFARDVGGTALQSQLAKTLVGRLPIPVIGVPWFQLRHLPDALIVGHEVGHHVFRDFGLGVDAEQFVVEALTQGETAVVPAQARWRTWLEEAFADVYGALVGGSAYVLTLADFLMVEGVNALTDGRGGYPPSAVRVALTLATLREADYRIEELDLRCAPLLVGLSTQARLEVEVVAHALVSQALPTLGAPLSAVLEPIDWDAKAEAKNLLLRWDPGAGDIRTLLASAALAFSEDPVRYREISIISKVLGRAREIQQPGTRFRGGGVLRDDTAVERTDAAASQKLYDLITAD